MSEFSRETLLNIIETDHVQCGEASALARMALAAMDSEPVAYTDERNLGYIDRGRETAYLWGKQNSEASDVALYRHAQPALVIPNEMTADQAYEIGYYYGDPVNVFARGANWMRQHIIDSTLAAAQHDTPALNSVQSVVTVPGKWIPVSERMPEDRTQVILWDAEIGEVTSGHYSHKTQTFYHCGDAIENEITHWMAPPAAPQEVRGE
ncbi:Eaa1 [Klebsiella pneumoniae]|uniref:DUF551 domain-containing protein n=2 Tax=Klebsiella/Raoultella group TaxID=2890311 RepID=UPI000E2C14B1|nr:DUF551 domain-containing protein [Klebsiella pneumoniae]SVN47034.1 Eaa1 [Klebsiella pneumoniae]